MANDPRICDYCQNNVLLSNRPSGQYQTDEKTRSLSLSQGCPFCLVLERDVAKARESLPASRLLNVTYCWTLRPAGKIRETQQHIIVTFRPIVSGNSEAASKLVERVFFLLPEDDLGQLPLAAELGFSTDSAHSRGQVRDWVEDCVRNHPQCNPGKSGPGFVPTRLVDLGEPGAEWAAKSVRVVNTARQRIKERYMTLSHCWGKSKPFWNLTKAALIGSKVPEILLPDIGNKNITEATSVARTIGIRYIWIDSLCIVQDDSDDWEREGQLMHQVYRNSHCNIAAVDSQDRDGGLFRDRDDETKQQSVPVRFMAPVNRPSLFGQRAWRVLHSDLWQDEVLGRALYSRAWVFQERLLSPRLVHFSRGQIFWDCATLSACEAIPDGLPSVLDEGQTATDRHWRERLQVSAAAPMGRIIGTADDSLQAFWASAVRFYTSCDITRQSDRLRAVWGIAKLVRDAEREEFAAGLWEQGLHQQLAWRVLGGGEALVIEDRGHDFPSWSWASAGAPVQVADRLADYGDYFVTGHDGGALSFKLKKRVYAAPSEWTDGLPPITPPDLIERSLDVVSEALTIDQSHLDLMPELRSKALEVRGHISQGTLSMAGGDGSTWYIHVQSPAGASGLIRAFPDRRPERDHMDCLFVVLCARDDGDDDDDEEYSDEESEENEEDEEEEQDQEDEGDEEDDDEEDDEEMDDKDNSEDDDDESKEKSHSWSGTGIIVTLNSDRTYTRVGAMEFADLDGEMWAAMRRRCCQRSLEDGEHEITDGVRFTLV